MRRFINMILMMEADDHLRDLVIRLDGLLTDRPEAAASNARQQAYLFDDSMSFLEKVSSRTYYLADGGYSRLLINDEGDVVGIDAISRKDVKQRWNDPEVQQVAHELSNYLKASLDRMV